MTSRFSNTAHLVGVFWAVLAASSVAWAQPTSAAPSNAGSIGAANRTIQTANFTVAWNTGADTEAITTLDWMGGPSVTVPFLLNTCGNAANSGNVQFFGNAWSPPDPQSGGLVLVGGGTITPAGTVPWSAKILPVGIEATVNSNSTNCPPSSAGINVQTTYRFFSGNNTHTNWFEVQRVFDFTATAFPHDLRPFISHIDQNAGYTDVLYPTVDGQLATAASTSCPYGCTGPVAAPGAAALSPLWDARQGWFAIHNPNTLQGVVVSRVPSTDPQGVATTPQLWIDSEGSPGAGYSNATSFLLLNPAAGFNGGLVTEVETLCFYNSSMWTPSLVPPPACRNTHIPLTLSPWERTFPGQIIGSTSLPQTAILTNTGTGSVVITGFASSGDFTQANNCPASLAAGASCKILVSFKPTAAGIRSGSVSVIDTLDTSPQTLSLAGLGVSAQ